MSRSLNLSRDLAAYLVGNNPSENPILELCRVETQRLYPREAWIQISPEQGAFLQFLMQLHSSRHVLEIGTFTGYSSLAFALRLASVVTIDVSEEYQSVAKEFWLRAGVADRIEPLLGPATKVLQGLIAARAGSFDLAFIDADKEPVVEYYELALKLLRVGGLLIVDNVLWDGKVVDPAVTDPATTALQRVVAHARTDARVSHNLCSVGDGLLMAIKR